MVIAFSNPPFTEEYIFFTAEISIFIEISWSNKQFGHILSHPSEISLGLTFIYSWLITWIKQISDGIVYRVMGGNLLSNLYVIIWTKLIGILKM